MIQKRDMGAQPLPPSQERDSPVSRGAQRCWMSWWPCRPFLFLLLFGPCLCQFCGSARPSIPGARPSLAASRSSWAYTTRPAIARIPSILLITYCSGCRCGDGGGRLCHGTRGVRLGAAASEGIYCFPRYFGDSCKDETKLGTDCHSTLK